MTRMTSTTYSLFALRGLKDDMSLTARTVSCQSVAALNKFERGCHESISENLRRAKGALRLRNHPYLRVARRTARSHGAHDQSERKALPGGDGQRLQDGLAGGHLRDPSLSGRDRGPEKPAEGVDEAS